MSVKDTLCKYCADIIYFDVDDRRWVHVYNGKAYQGCILQATIAEPISTDERIRHYRIVVNESNGRKTVITTKKRNSAVRYLNFENCEVYVIVERVFYGE